MTNFKKMTSNEIRNEKKYGLFVTALHLNVF